MLPQFVSSLKAIAQIKCGGWAEVLGTWSHLKEKRAEKRVTYMRLRAAHEQYLGITAGRGGGRPPGFEF